MTPRCSNGKRLKNLFSKLLNGIILFLCVTPSINRTIFLWRLSFDDEFVNRQNFECLIRLAEVFDDGFSKGEDLDRHSYVMFTETRHPSHLENVIIQCCAKIVNL